MQVKKQLAHHSHQRISVTHQGNKRATSSERRAARRRMKTTATATAMTAKLTLAKLQYKLKVC